MTDGSHPLKRNPPFSAIVRASSTLKVQNLTRLWIFLPHKKQSTSISLHLFDNSHFGVLITIHMKQLTIHEQLMDQSPVFFMVADVGHVLDIILDGCAWSNELFIMHSVSAHKYLSIFQTIFVHNFVTWKSFHFISFQINSCAKWYEKISLL